MSKTSGQPVNKPKQTAHFSVLRSKCPTDLAAHNRDDLYWTEKWDTKSDAQWSIAERVRQQNPGSTSLPARLRMDQDTALGNVLSSRGWRDRLDLLAVVDGWRTVSAEQAAALTGNKGLMNPENKTVPALFASSMIDLGAFSTGLFSSRPTGFLYRPCSSDAVKDELFPNMTYPERVSVTGGYDWSSGGQYDRHNLLSTELGLRIAEYLPVGTVLPEKMSTYDLLAGSGIGRPVLKTGAAKRADLTVVREDGLRVAIEVTATVSDHFEAKVRSWAKLLSETPMADSGLVVLFLAAESPGKIKANTDASATSIRGRIYSAIQKAIKEFPGTSYDRIASRMGVATWREFFPAQHTVSDRFMKLRADFPTGAPDALWQSVDVLDVFGLEFHPSDTFDAEQVITNSMMLACVPHWLRKGPEAEKASDLLLDHTLAMCRVKSVPVPTASRPNRVSTRPLKAGIGAAADTRPPRRLRTVS